MGRLNVLPARDCSRETQLARYMPVRDCGAASLVDDPTVADLEAVTRGSFNVFGIRLVRGRFLNESDSPASGLAVLVNESFVRRFFPNTDPLSHLLMLGRMVPNQERPGPPVEYQIVGFSTTCSTTSI